MGIEREPRWSPWTSAAVALPVLVFLLLYSWRPLKLGLYSDDWLVFLHPQPGSFVAWSDLMAAQASRPLAVAVTWLVLLVSDWLPERVQIVNVVLLAASAAAVGWLTYALAAAISKQHAARLWGAGVAASAYLAFPWTLGFCTGTGTVGMTPATVLFCLAARLLVAPGGERLSTQIVASLLMGGSFLAYESFYGQFIIVIALATVLGSLRGSSLRVILRPALLMLAVNVACFAYNRFAAGNRKSFSGDWLQIFLYSYWNAFWPIMLKSFREVAPIIAVGLVVALGCGVALLFKTVGRPRTVLAVAAITLGILGAGLFYAMAGYGLTAVGTFARVTVVMSLYGAVLSGLASAAAVARLTGQPWLARTHILATVTLVVAFGIASAYRLVDWAGSWQTQLDVLNQLPDEAKVVPAPDRGYLYIGPLGPPVVPIAAAPWEVAGTIAYRVYQDDPALARRIMTAVWNGSGQRWVGLAPDWSIDFDGETIRQYVCGNPVPAFSLQAKELWVWTLGEPGLKMASPGFHVACKEPAAAK